MEHIFTAYSKPQGWEGRASLTHFVNIYFSPSVTVTPTKLLDSIKFRFALYKHYFCTTTTDGVT